MAGTVDPNTRYRQAFAAGRNGRQLPAGLADLADGDPKIDSAYDAGQGGGDFATWQTENGAPSPAQSGGSGGARRAGVHKGRGSSSSRRSRPSPVAAAVPARYSGGGVSGGATQAGGDAAGVVLGLVGAAMLLSLIDYGPKGPLLWLKAKFLNQAAGAPGSGSTTVVPPAGAQLVPPPTAADPNPTTAPRPGGTV